jgi:hypothetical protein
MDVKETILGIYKVDKDFDIEVIQRCSSPYKNKKGCNVPPHIKIYAKTTWGKMMWCNKHQRLSNSGYSENGIIIDIEKYEDKF